MRRSRTQRARSHNQSGAGRKAGVAPTAAVRRPAASESPEPEPQRSQRQRRARKPQRPGRPQQSQRDHAATVARKPRNQKKKQRSRAQSSLRTSGAATAPFVGRLRAHGLEAMRQTPATACSPATPLGPQIEGQGFETWPALFMERVTESNPRCQLGRLEFYH